MHGCPTAVLYAPGKKFLGLFGSGLKSLTSHLPVLEGSPILYVSNQHTRRMEVLSRARQALPDAQVIMVTGHASVPNEHVDATCINQPHSVPSLREGLRGLHELEKVSDWTIFCPAGRFDAERVGVLVHVLESAPPELKKEWGL